MRHAWMGAVLFVSLAVRVLAEGSGAEVAALGRLEQAVRTDAANPALAVAYADALRRAGRLEEAVLAIEGAASLPGGAEKVGDLRAVLLRERAEADAEVRSIDASLKSKTDDVAAWLRRARRCLSLRAGDLALESADAAIAVTPDSAEARGLRARALLLLGSADEALVEFAAATKARPKDYGLRFRYMTALLDLGRSEEGDRQRLALDECELETAEEGVLLAEEWARSDLKEAIRVLDASMTKDPRNPYSLYLRGRWVSEMDELKYLAGADPHLTEALALLDGRDRSLQSLIHYERGTIQWRMAVHVQAQTMLEMQGHLPKAVARYDEAIQLNPHFFEAYLERGICLYGMKEWESSKRDLVIYLAARPERRQLVEERLAWWSHLHESWREVHATLLRELEKMSEAAEAIRKASSICPKCQGWHMTTSGCSR